MPTTLFHYNPTRHDEVYHTMGAVKESPLEVLVALRDAGMVPNLVVPEQRDVPRIELVGYKSIDFPAGHHTRKYRGLALREATTPVSYDNSVDLVRDYVKGYVELTGKSPFDRAEPFRLRPWVLNVLLMAKAGNTDIMLPDAYELFQALSHRELKTLADYTATLEQTRSTDSVQAVHSNTSLYRHMDQVGITTDRRHEAHPDFPIERRSVEDRRLSPIALPVVEEQSQSAQDT